MFQANYTAGLRILDIGDIGNPAEIAFFDTTPGNNAVSFEGAWSNYPFFASGVVVVSSIGEGLFVLQPIRGGPPALSITLTPSSPNIEISPTGASFTYLIEVTNTSNASVNTNVWLDIANDGGPTRRSLHVHGLGGHVPDGRGCRQLRVRKARRRRPV